MHPDASTVPNLLTYLHPGATTRCFTVQGGQPLIFMVGCGHLEDGRFVFRCFVARIAALTQAVQLDDRAALEASFEALVALYTATGDATKAADWKAKLGQ